MAEKAKGRSELQSWERVEEEMSHYIVMTSNYVQGFLASKLKLTSCLWVRSVRKKGQTHN